MSQACLDMMELCMWSQLEVKEEWAHKSKMSAIMYTHQMLAFTHREVTQKNIFLTELTVSHHPGI